VKLKSDGKVMMMVSVFWLAPVGVTNLIACVEVALTVKDDIVSEAFVIAAASATETGITKYITKIATASTILVTLFVNRLKANRFMVNILIFK
jgi:hypothetical protein